MSETIQSISNGTYTLGETNKLTFSAGPGITISEPSEGVVRIGNDETVLWSGASTTNATLSEPITGFERVKISFSHNGNNINEFQVSQVSGGVSCPLTIIPTFNNSYASIYTQSWKFSDITTFTTAFKCKEWWGNAAAVSSRDSSNHTINCIWGINRSSGSNA